MFKIGNLQEVGWTGWVAEVDWARWALQLNRKERRCAVCQKLPCHWNCAQKPHWKCFLK